LVTEETSLACYLFPTGHSIKLPPSDRAVIFSIRLLQIQNYRFLKTCLSLVEQNLEIGKSGYSVKARVQAAAHIPARIAGLVLRADWRKLARIEQREAHE